VEFTRNMVIWHLITQIEQRSVLIQICALFNEDIRSTKCSQTLTATLWARAPYVSQRNHIILSCSDCKALEWIYESTLKSHHLTRSRSKVLVGLAGSLLSTHKQAVLASRALQSQLVKCQALTSILNKEHNEVCQNA
jgi:hypothetical protein